MQPPSINDFVIGSQDPATGNYGTAAAYAALGQAIPGAAELQCFDANGAIKPIYAAPTAPNKFPIFRVTVAGIRECQSGVNTPNVNDTTFNIGCSGASGAAGEWQ